MSQRIFEEIATRIHNTPSQRKYWVMGLSRGGSIALKQAITPSTILL